MKPTVEVLRSLIDASARARQAVNAAGAALERAREEYGAAADLADQARDDLWRMINEMTKGEGE